MKRLIPGIKNSTKFRAIINGVGIHMTVAQLNDMVFSSQRAAVWRTLESCVNSGAKGLAQNIVVYDEKMNPTNVEVQVNLI